MKFAANPQLAAMTQRAHQVLQGRNLVAHQGTVVPGHPAGQPSPYVAQRAAQLAARQRTMRDWLRPVPGIGSYGLPALMQVPPQ